MMDAPLSLNLEDSFFRTVMATNTSLESSVPSFGDLSLSAFESRGAEKQDSRGVGELSAREGALSGASFAAFNADLRSASGDGDSLPKPDAFAAHAATGLGAAAVAAQGSQGQLVAEDAPTGPAGDISGVDGPSEAPPPGPASEPTPGPHRDPDGVHGKKRPRSEARDGTRRPTKRQNAWTEDEVARFFDGVEQHNADFEAIAGHVGSKTADQVRVAFGREYSRAYNFYRSDGMLVPARRGANADLTQQAMLLKKWRTEEVAFQDPPKHVETQVRSAPAAVRKKSFAKHRVQLVPQSERDEGMLRDRGFNPLVMVVLRGHRPLSDVTQHLADKWGAVLPRDTRLDLLVDLDPTTTIDGVYQALGNPETFRIQYQLWVPAPDGMVGDSTISRLLANSITFTGLMNPSDPDVHDVLKLGCEDANDGVQSVEPQNGQLQGAAHPVLAPQQNAFASIFKP